MAPPLGSDIIDCVLTLLPDFATLLSAILVSKSFQGAFQAHPSSILTSVATTQIGPEVFPCAIRLAHFNRDEYLASRTTYVQDFPSERKFSNTEASAVTPYVAKLAKNDNVARELELFFSITCKDRATGTESLLNPRESLRFRRAFYRWWLFINLFPGCYLRSTRTARKSDGTESDEDDEDNNDSDTEDDTDDDNDDGADANAPAVYLAKSRILQKEFLSEFSDDEVAEVHQVHNLVAFATVYALNATPGANLLEYHLLWNGPFTPAEVFRPLRSFGEPELHFMEELNWDYDYPNPNWPGFLVYLQEKNYDTSKVSTNIWDPIQGSEVILDSKNEDTEECEECHSPSEGPKLWSSSNWHLLPCVITLPEMLNSLPGHLCWNSQETQPLKADPWSYTSFVDRHVSLGIKDWSDGKVLCKLCVLKLLGRHVLNSLRERKAQHGPQLEDCWYGYRCRTQRRPAHAIKLNHLCEPTRGDR